MYTLIALAPLLVTLALVGILTPCLVAWHHRDATRPVESVPQDGWASALDFELEAVAGLVEALETLDLPRPALPCPLGSTLDAFWEAVALEASDVAPLPLAA